LEGALRERRGRERERSAQHCRADHAASSGLDSAAMLPKIELNHKVHVLTRKEELDSVRVAGKLVVVIDVLFATTTMVAALAHGALEVIPVLDEAAARAEDARRGAGSSVLAGELYAETLPGFVHPAPLALVAHGVKGRTVIYSTTNGTVAMSLAAGARRVYCGALLNCRLGRMMSARGLRHEVEFACRIDAFPVVPALDDARLHLVG